MVAPDEVNALLNEWLWVKRVTELCDEVRSQFEVSAERCSILLMGPRDFQKELETIWTEIVEKQRAILTERLDNPDERDLELTESSGQRELVIGAIESLRRLSKRGDASAKEVLVTLVVTFPELGEPEDTLYPFSFNLKATGNLAERLNARKNMLFTHELRRRFLVSVARSFYLESQTPAWPERPSLNCFSLFIVNIGSSALVPAFRWYAGQVQAVRRSRCDLKVSHWLSSGDEQRIRPREELLNISIDSFVTGRPLSARPVK